MSCQVVIDIKGSLIVALSRGLVLFNLFDPTKNFSLREFYVEGLPEGKGACVPDNSFIRPGSGDAVAPFEDVKRAGSVKLSH